MKLDSAFKFDHELQMVVQLGRAFESFMVCEAGAADKSSILNMDCVMAQFMPNIMQGAGQEKRTELVFVVDRSGDLTCSRVRSLSAGCGCGCGGNVDLCRL